MTGGFLGMCASPGKVRYEIRRQVGGPNSKHFASVYISPPIDGTDCPVWQPQRIKLAKFSNSNANGKV